MITHFDMVTGQVVEDENHDTPAPPASGVAAMPSLRLMTVQEATAIASQPARQVPADIAMSPVNLILARWQ